MTGTFSVLCFRRNAEHTKGKGFGSALVIVSR
jgi:hypothetical protein